MKFLVRLLTVCLALVIAFYGLVMLASESGEVVVLTTKDASDAAVDTRLWTVEHDGSRWLRSGSPGSGWYARLLANGNVTVRLGNERYAATAIPTPAATAVVNALMNEKYGWADDLIDRLFGRDDAIAIRLVPTDAPAP